MALTLTPHHHGHIGAESCEHWGVPCPALGLGAHGDAHHLHVVRDPRPRPGRPPDPVGGELHAAWGFAGNGTSL